MFNGKVIAVVVPCYNEERLLPRVVQSMPEFVDLIFLVDDASKDATLDVANRLATVDPRVVVIARPVNGGVGAAIASGYVDALAREADIAVVMAGDAQMDPADLPAIVGPIALGDVDYTKGNRLVSGDAWEVMPRVRFFGNAILSLLTKFASGYWHVADSQCGYTAISRSALERINWSEMYPRYGQPNDLLVRLNIHGFRVRDVAIRSIYGIGEKSGIKPIRMIPHFSRLIWRLFWMRMFRKYVVQDFHPLVLFYSVALVLLPAGLLIGLALLLARFFVGPVAGTSALFAALLLMMGTQFLLFGMWLDMEHNKNLR